MPNLLIAATIARTLGSFLYPYAEHFSAQGWPVDGAARDAPRHRPTLMAYRQLFDVCWSRTPIASGNLLRAAPYVRELVISQGYDLVHVHTPVAAFVTRFALRNVRTGRGHPKVIYTAHGFHFHERGSPLNNLFFLLLEKLAGRWTDCLIVINEEDRAAARRFRLVPPEKLEYMPGIGVDTARYSRRAVPPAEIARARSDLGLAESGPVILMVAEFIPRKRHADAVKAFAALGRTDAHLVLAGSGPLEAGIRCLAASLGVEQRVHFAGYRRDIPALMGASDALVLPSIQEGLPRSILEALSMELPVIGSDIRGTRELLRDGAGLLVPAGDVTGLAQAMSWLLDHPAEARQMGQTGRQRVEERYALQSVIRRHELLYARLLGTAA